MEIGLAEMDLILASTSAYRQRLLARLHIPFRSLAPGVAESRQPGEDAGAMSARLALAKARKKRHAIEFETRERSSQRDDL